MHKKVVQLDDYRKEPVKWDDPHLAMFLQSIHNVTILKDILKTITSGYSAELRRGSDVFRFRGIHEPLVRRELESRFLPQG